VSSSVLRNNAHAGIRALDGSVIGGPGVAERNHIHANGFAGIQFDGNVTITNNVIGLDFDGSAYLSPNPYGIYFNCCTQPSGTITGNTIVASTRGIDLQYDAAMTISGNRIGMDPSGSAAMSAGGSYGISLYYSYGGSIVDNVIGGFSVAVNADYNSTVTVSGNRIGTTGDGSASSESVSTGVRVYYNYGSRIDGNLISGVFGNAIYLQNSYDTVVYGNMIGTDASGTNSLGNDTGVYIASSSFSAVANNTIDNNVFGGNFVAISSSDTSYSTFSNNLIGGSVPNFFAFQAECGTNLSIVDNLITNNEYGGLDLRAVQNSVIQGNTINGNRNADGGVAHGLTLSYTNCGFSGGQVKLPGKALSFGLENESSDNQVTGNAISSNAGRGIFIEGGSGNAMSQNVVNSNADDGIRIDARYDSYGAVIAPAIGNSMVSNTVYDNANKNINLAFDGGPRPNDPGDPDGGPNNGQNYPTVTSVSRDTVNNQTTIAFDLDSKGGTYLVEFFSNPAPGMPAGRVSFGTTFMTLAADGSASGTFTVARTDVDYISATATRAGPESPAVQDTSEYSPLVSATTLPVPAVTVTPSSINFGDIVVGRSSGDSVVTIASVGTGDYIIRALREGSCTGPAICTSGSFACSTTCTDGSVWAPGNSCTITASFNPSALGAQSKTLALCDDTPGSPRTITFAGNGVPPPTVDIYWTPASWSFGEVLVGAQGSSKTFTLTNGAGSVVYLGAATVSNPDFVITGSSCGATLNAGATCAADVAFVPSSKGPINSTLQIVGSNVPPTSPAALRNKVTTATTSAATAVLQGAGAQFGELRLPASLSFGTLLLHGETRSQNVELRNTGNGPIAISGVTVSGPFTMANGCGTSLAPGASCTISVTFNPANLGTANGTLNVVTDASGGSRAIALTAIVIAEARPVVRVAPNLVGFGNNQIGSDSKAQPITITNEGAEVAQLLPFVLVQPQEGKTEFIVSSTTCGATLAPQASCVANVVFHALGFSERKGELQVPSNAPDSPKTATLTGTGCRPFAAGDRSGRDPCK
jgi:parallel beta-helix repeat protein